MGTEMDVESEYHMAITPLASVRDWRPAALQRHSRRPRGRMRARIISVMTLASVMGLPGLGHQSAEAASYLRGYEVVFASSAYDSRSAKEAIAVCPAGKQVLGGAGMVSSGDPVFVHVPGVTLTALVPYRQGSGSYAYTARAAEIYSGESTNWAVWAYAFCSNPVSGYHIVTSSTPFSSRESQERSVDCPRGQQVLGSGAMINFHFTYDSHGRQIVYEQGIGLQMVRPVTHRISTGLDYGQAKAHEAPEGYPYSWNLVVQAVCADPLKGYRIFTQQSNVSSDDIKLAYAGASYKTGCPTEHNSVYLVDPPRGL